MRLDATGQPIYGDRDQADLAEMKALGLPFWLAGSYARPERVVEAIPQDSLEMVHVDSGGAKRIVFHVPSREVFEVAAAEAGECSDTPNKRFAIQLSVRKEKRGSIRPLVYIQMT